MMTDKSNFISPAVEWLTAIVARVSIHAAPIQVERDILCEVFQVKVGDLTCVMPELWVYMADERQILEFLEKSGISKQPVCGDKHFGADARCALEPGHNGAHRQSDMYWVHPSDHARCDATTFCGGKKHRCDSAAGHEGFHDSGTGITAIRWDGTKINPRVTEAAHAVRSYVVQIDNMAAPEHQRGWSELVADQMEKGGCYMIPAGESFILLEAPILHVCRACSSPAAFRSAYCVYCAHSTHEGQASAAEADRITAGAMLNEEAHPGIVLARARNEAALVAERPKSTKSSREAALPHPWEAWRTPGWES